MVVWNQETQEWTDNGMPLKYIEFIADSETLGATPVYVYPDRIDLCDGSYGLVDLAYRVSSDEDETATIVEHYEVEAMNRILAGELQGDMHYRSDLPVITFRLISEV